jgi:hypothetical protein
MTCRAAFPQGGMLENEGPGLLTMALRAVFIPTRHRQSAGWLHDVAAMRVMTLNAIHLLFHHRVMLWQPKLDFRGTMTLEAGRRISAGVDDEFPTSATAGDMKTASAMASLAAGLPCSFRRFQVDPGVGARWKDAREIRMAFHTGFVAHKAGPRYLRRSLDRPRHRRAGIDQERGGNHGAEGQDRNCCLAWLQVLSIPCSVFDVQCSMFRV